MAFKPLYVVGDYVEILHHEKWQLGLVEKMHMRGYIEYEVCLLSTGEMVECQALTMRKSDAFTQDLVREMSQDMVDSSQPEDDAKSQRFPYIAGSGSTQSGRITRRSPVASVSPGDSGSPELYSPVSEERASASQPTGSSFKIPPKTSSVIRPAKTHILRGRIVAGKGFVPLSDPAKSIYKAKKVESPGRDIIVPRSCPRVTRGQSNVSLTPNVPRYFSPTSSPRVRGPFSSPPSVTRVVRTRGMAATATVSSPRLPSSSTSGHPSTSSADIRGKVPATSSRFPEVTDEDIASLQMNSKSSNTLRTTAWGVGVFRDWLRSASLEIDFEDLRTDVLAEYLKRFYAAARNQQGELYSKSSLLGIRGAIQRHLSLPPHNLNINIVTAPEFNQANTVITGTLRKMKKEGLDKTKHHPSITPGDMMKMYKSGALSRETPTKLQWKVFFEICLHFGRRGREGLRDLKKEHILFLFDDQGTEYATLDFNSLEKNHQGLDIHESEHIQLMYATGKGLCPVASLKFYLSKLHPMCQWFFQRPKVIKFVDSDVWYYNSPVGVNSIAAYMPKISKFAGTSRRYTNHCVRATTITTLRELAVDYQDIISVTGHKSVTSIGHYSKTAESTRKKMSKALSASVGIGSPVPKKGDDVSFEAEAAARAIMSLGSQALEKKPAVLSDEVSTQGYSQSSHVLTPAGCGVKIQESAAPKSKCVKKKVATSGSLFLRNVLSDIDKIAKSAGVEEKKSPVLSQARARLEKRWKKRALRKSRRSEKVVVEESTESDSNDSPTTIPSSQDSVDEEDSKKDDGSGGSSFFKGCKIDKIQIIYKK